MEFICIIIPSGEWTHFLLICFTYSHSLLFLMDNEWKHSPVGIPTTLLETDVLETTDKLPVTVRQITHAYSQSGPNREAGMSNLLASLCHTGRRRAVLGHTLNTLQHIITHRKIS